MVKKKKKEVKFQYKWKYMLTDTLWGEMHAGWGNRKGVTGKMKLQLGLGQWYPVCGFLWT